MATPPEGRRHTFWLAGLGVFSVIALGGLLWFGYLALRGADNGEVPVVAAPKGDYKVAPKDPGGLDVDHQDVSIYEALVRGRPGAVPETVGPPPAAPRPVVPPPEPPPSPEPTDAVATGAPMPLPAPRNSDAIAAVPPAEPQQAARAGVFMQLGAFGTYTAAREAWEELRQRHDDLLGSMEAKFMPADEVIRIRAGPVSTSALAQLVCEQLKARNADCFIVR